MESHRFVQELTGKLSTVWRLPELVQKQMAEVYYLRPPAEYQRYLLLELARQARPIGRWPNEQLQYQLRGGCISLAV